MKYISFTIKLFIIAVVNGCISAFMSSTLHNRYKSIELLAKRDFSPPIDIKQENSNGLVYTLELPKRAGINWGSDISFRWIYVLDVESGSAAAESGLIQKGDYIVAFDNTSTIGQDFDFVLTTLSKQPPRLNYTFFRGTKEQLIGKPIIDPLQTTYKVIVQQEGKPDVTLPCKGGTTLRNVLLGNGINVYRSLTRFTNCNGKQRCGTCIVEVTGGVENCSRRSLDEDMVLRENPNSYRLSCITQVYGDVNVIVQGPVGAAQWTR